MNRTIFRLPFFLCFTLLLAISCSTKKEGQNKVFEQMTKTGIDFTNTVKNNPNFNIFSYRNFYNGGGAAIGDINNDGLADVFFTANMGSNKLYLNKGNWLFDDISAKAGFTSKEDWSTGVVMVDINNVAIASDLLLQYEEAYLRTIACPHCNATEIISITAILEKNLLEKMIAKIFEMKIRTGELYFIHFLIFFIL